MSAELKLLTKIQSMRDITDHVQLSELLENSLFVIKRRDNLFNELIRKENTLAGIENTKKKLKKQTGFGAVLLYGFCMLIMSLMAVIYIDSFFPALSDKTLLAVWGGLTILLTFLVISFNKIRVKKQVKGIEDFLPICESGIKQAQLDYFVLSDFFWCAEIIPEEYRSQMAMEIMLSAIRASKADSWKECCAIYDNELNKAEMRAYQNQQMNMMQQIRSNTASAANAAWSAAFSASSIASRL
jgi:hypothetical protein